MKCCQKLLFTLELIEWQAERILSKLKVETNIVRHGAGKKGYLFFDAEKSIVFSLTTLAKEIQVC